MMMEKLFVRTTTIMVNYLNDVLSLELIINYKLFKMKNFYCFILFLIFGCSGGDDGSENAVPIVFNTFTEKYEGKGFGTPGDKYFFFGVESFFSVVDELYCTNYKTGSNFFNNDDNDVCYIRFIEDIKQDDSEWDHELVIEGNCNYDTFLFPSATGFYQKLIFRVEKGGEWLNVTYDEGFANITERHYKTTETLSSLCD
jgi:hypothetical protein